MPVIWQGSIALEEQPDSPAWEFSERVTARRTWRGPYFICLDSAPLKGAIGTGVTAGMRVTKSTVTKERGGIGVLRVEYEGGQPPQGATLPDDEATIDDQQIEIAIEKHPRYAGLSEGLLTDVKTLEETSKENADHTSALSRVEADSLANELYLKKRAGETHYALWVPVYRLVIHSWFAPTDLTTGGFVDTPPNYPVIPPPGYEWLRGGDKASFNGSTWTVEKTWIAAPQWDADIYP